MANGTAVEKKAPATLKTMLEERRPEIKAMLPTHVNVERFMKSALLAVARDHNLQACTPLSLLTAVINAAELGLDFTPGKAHAYLVKYGDKAQFMPSYKGMIDLARRSGDVKKIESFIVKEKDVFKIRLGTSPGIDHEYPAKGSRGDMIGVYAVATFTDGETQFDYMTREEIDAIRKRSKAANSGPWVTDYNEMARKTVVRRLFKYLPCSSDMLTKAIEADNQAIGLVDYEVEPMEDGDKTRNLAEKLKAKIQEPEPEQAEVVDEDTGEVVEPEPEQPKQKRSKKSDAAGTFDPALANETLAELVNTGKITKAQYCKAVRDKLDYPTDAVPPTTLHQSESVTVLEALGYAASEEV
jgi:recombination protein RecT